MGLFFLYLEVFVKIIQKLENRKNYISNFFQKILLSRDAGDMIYPVLMYLSVMDRSLRKEGMKCNILSDS